jgi:hypothetical protein
MESSVPTRNRLEAAAIFAPTEEERLAAKRLLAAGLYRAPNKGELAWEDHPFNLAAQCPGDTSSVGQLVESIVNAQPEELGDDDVALADVLDKTPLLPLPAAPKPAPPVAEEPLGESMEKLIQKPVSRKPVTPPSWQVAPPTPQSDDFGREPLDW